MLSYIEPVFRPPSEAHSLILQVTNGCSWNNCTFCEMYTEEQKKFRPTQQDKVFSDIAAAARSVVPFEKVFLADGDAMVLSMRKLTAILQEIRTKMPWVKRVSSYCLPRNLNKKSVEDLKQLKALGLDILFVGCESGDDQVLEGVSKGETYATQKDALLKIKQAGLRTSVMILNGLGGRALSEQHAINSARLMNECQPDYLSTLVVSFPTGEERFRAGFTESWQALQQRDLFLELRCFISHLELQNTVFRSDHASNYLPLKGNLGVDKQALLEKLDMALHHPEQVQLRQEWQRGL
ncbi:MAG: radical SAM protein [Bermanella sp.]